MSLNKRDNMIVENQSGLNINQLAMQYFEESNETKKNKTMETMIPQIDKIMYKLIMRCNIPTMDFDDVRQELRIVFINCLKNYNGTKDFSSFSYQCMNNHVNYLFQYHNCSKRKPKQEDDTSDDTMEYKDDKITNYYLSNNDEDEIILNDFLDRMSLSKRQRAILNCKTQGLELKDVSDVYPEYKDVSTSTLYLDMKNIKNKIKSFYLK